MDNIELLQMVAERIEQNKEETEPHLCDYRYYRNEGLNIAMEVINSVIEDIRYEKWKETL